MRRAPSKNPKLHKIKQRKEREKRKRMGTLNDKNEEEQEEEGDETLMGKMIKQFSKKHSAEQEPATEINTMGASSVSPERRKTIHVALSELVQNRLVKAKTINDPPRQSISLQRVPENDSMSDPDGALNKKFTDTLLEQQALINFHKRQFETILNNKVAIDNLPDHMRKILEKGRQGIDNYLRLLGSIKNSQLKDNLREKFKTTEKQMSEADSSIIVAEDKVARVMNLMNLKSSHALNQPTTGNQAGSNRNPGRSLMDDPRARHAREKVGAINDSDEENTRQ